MSDKYFTKDFQRFIDACGDLNYHEIFELAQAAQGNTEVLSVFTREKANGDSEDIIIGYKPTEAYLRMTPKQAVYFPKWIEEHLMDNYDADSWYGFQYALDHDKDKSNG